MELIINGRKAVLKKGSSFEYVSENRAFSDADAYTMSISLPLAGCAQNLAIFGHIDRFDINTRRIVLDASIVDHFCSRFGVVTVVEVSEKEVKCQFLEGRSAQNFMTTFDDKYINELDLGSYPSDSLPQYPNHGDIDHGHHCVALPWVNDSDGADGFMNNEVVSKNGVYEWAESTLETGKLSYMPYLIYIAKKICQAVGYTYDFSQWEDSRELYLLICNVLPASWDVPQFARALPHWTVAEFFEELEKILVCEFDIDHHAGHISMQFSRNIKATKEVVVIDDVLDSYSSEVAYEDDLCHFKGLANLRYADRGDFKWKLEQCQWFIDLIKREGKCYKEFQTYYDFLEWRDARFGILGPGPTDKDSERGSDVGLLIHVVDFDFYGMWNVYYGHLESYPNLYFYDFARINQFGDVVNNPDSGNDLVLQFVPARIDTTDDAHGKCLFLNPSNFSENEEYDEWGVRQPLAYSTFLKGEPDSSAEYYDKILLAYWDGRSENDGTTSYEVEMLPPCPIADERFSLRNRYGDYLSGMVINPKERIKVSWLSNTIPDVRSIFHIRGKRYLCEKITATFSENGMSQLLKGDFSPIVD